MTIKIKNDRYLFENGLFLKVYLHNVKQKVKKLAYFKVVVKAKC